MRLTIYIIFLLIVFPIKEIKASFLKKGSSAYNKGHYKEAIKFYSTALKKKQNLGVIYFNMAQCFYRLDKPWKTLVYYKKVIALHPSFKLVFLNSAKVLYELKEYKQAMKMLDEISSSNSYYYDSLLLKGCCYMKIDSLARSMIFFERAIDIKSDEPMPYLLYGETAVKMKDTREAIRWLEKGMIHCNRSEPLILFLAQLYFNQKEFLKALDLYGNLYDMNKKNISYLYNIAECYKRNKQPLLAVDIFKKIIYIKPKSYDAIDAIIRIYKKLELWGEVEFMLIRSSRLYPARYKKEIRDLFNLYKITGNYRLEKFGKKIRNLNLVKLKYTEDKL